MRQVFILIFLTKILSALSENIVTFNEFRKAFTDNTYPAPTREQYDTVMRMAPKAGGITTKHELAMFIAQVLWESAGLQFKKEIKCAQSSCPSDYRTGKEKESKYYFGRGYIQLTWLYNYEQCSQELYGDQRLVDNPDLVSDTEDGAWGSAFWYWRKHCHSADGVQKGFFGASTMAINGVLECKGPYKVKAFKRYTIYVRVLQAFKLTDVKPRQDGCYPMPPEAEAPDFHLCQSVGIHKNAVGMYGWCNDNCNAEDPNCPTDMCGCEGGNPVKKPKNVTKSDTQDVRNRSRLPNQIEPKLVAKPSEHIMQGVRVDRVPPKIQFPTRDPYSVLELSNVTEMADKNSGYPPVPVYQSEPVYIEPIPDAKPAQVDPLPHNNYNDNLKNHRLTDDKSDVYSKLNSYLEEISSSTPMPVKEVTTFKDPVIPYRSRRPNLMAQRARESHPETAPVRTINEDVADTPRRVVEPMVRRRPTVSNRRLNANVDKTAEQPTEAPEPKLNSGWDVFRYHEPMRISRMTTSSPEVSIEPIKPEVQPVSTDGRTRLLRNELGRLIRKRPVVRDPGSVN